MPTLARLVELLEVATDHLAALRAASEAHPLRGLGPEDLLTREEVARYVRISTSEVGPWLAAAHVPRALSEDRSTAVELSARARLSGR